MAEMKRALEVASGTGVLVNAVLSSAAVFKMIFYFPQNEQHVPLISIVSLCVTGVVVLLSFVGAFILLSWAIRPK
jgi:hypothetical protein